MDLQSIFLNDKAIMLATMLMKIVFYTIQHASEEQKVINTLPRWPATKVDRTALKDEWPVTLGVRLKRHIYEKKSVVPVWTLKTMIIVESPGKLRLRFYRRLTSSFLRQLMPSAVFQAAWLVHQALHSLLPRMALYYEWSQYLGQYKTVLLITSSTRAKSDT